jgi:hypothetical protein
MIGYVNIDFIVVKGYNCSMTLRVETVPSGHEGTPTPEILAHHNVAILTSTQYKNWSPLTEGEGRRVDDTDGVRGDLALQTAQSAIDMGYQIVFVDGLSSPAFQNELHRIFDEADLDPEKQGKGHFISRDPEDTMSGAQRRGLAEASKSGVAAIVWMEPEKTPLVPLLDKVTEPVLKKHADVVVIGRDKQGSGENQTFPGYPNYMVASEKKGNKWFNNMLRHAQLTPTQLPDYETESEFDTYFAPRVIANSPDVLAPFFDVYTYGKKDNTEKLEDFRQKEATAGRDVTMVDWEKLINPENYADFRFFPVVANMMNGKRVVGINVGFEYPPTQLANETTDNQEVLKSFKEKRFAQRIELTRTLKHFLRLRSNESKSREKSQLRPVAMTVGE